MEPGRFDRSKLLISPFLAGISFLCAYNLINAIISLNLLVIHLRVNGYRGSFPFSHHVAGGICQRMHAQLNSHKEIPSERFLGTMDLFQKIENGFHLFFNCVEPDILCLLRER